MSDEFDNSNAYYSPFWPLVILLAGFTLWLGYNIFQINEQRTNFNAQLVAATPTINQAVAAQNRLVSLMKDLVQTSEKDPYAKQILNEAISAGMINVSKNPNATNATANPAPPAGTDSSKSQ